MPPRPRSTWSTRYARKLAQGCPGARHRARLIVVGRPFPPFAGADDRGVSYQIGWSGGHTASQLLVRPDPSHQIRWLDVTGAVEAASRIDLGLPEQWQSLLTPRRRTPRPASGILAATMAELPGPDGATIAIVGLTHSLLPHGEPAPSCACWPAASHKRTGSSPGGHPPACAVDT